jgi:DNA-directed RNA polymerase specialized sigma24 family protein
MDENKFQSGGQSGFSADRREVFSTTQWTMVLAAGQDDNPSAGPALEQLCGKYWFPIYAFIRRRGSNPHEAEDLTQGFFAFALEKGVFKKVDREKGRFRTFLLAALTNFLANEWDKCRTLKRGGAYRIINWDDVAAEDLYRQEPIDTATPEKLFERRWASVLVEQVLDRLGQEYAAAGKETLFSKLEPGLTGELAAGTVAGWAAELRMTEGAVKVAVHRLRRRFGELLRKEIAATVANDGEVDEEIRHLFAAITN